MNAFYRLKKKDFSILMTYGAKKPKIFLGSLGFVNHDCCPNSKYLCSSSNLLQLKTTRTIKKGEELFVRYSNDYFGKNNEECEYNTCKEKQKSTIASPKKLKSGPSSNKGTKTKDSSEYERSDESSNESRNSQDSSDIEDDKQLDNKPKVAKHKNKTTPHQDWAEAAEQKSRATFQPLHQSLVDRYYKKQDLESDESSLESKDSVTTENDEADNSEDNLEISDTEEQEEVKKKQQRKENKRKLAHKNKIEQQNMLQNKMKMLQESELLSLKNASESHDQGRVTLSSIDLSKKIILLEKEKNNYKFKYENLKIKSDAQQSRIESLLRLNEKLQMILIDRHNTGTIAPKSTKSDPDLSPNCSPIKTINSRGKRMNLTPEKTGSPITSKNLSPQRAKTPSVAYCSSTPKSTSTSKLPLKLSFGKDAHKEFSNDDGNFDNQDETLMQDQIDPVIENTNLQTEKKNVTPEKMDLLIKSTSSLPEKSKSASNKDCSTPTSKRLSTHIEDLKERDSRDEEKTTENVNNKENKKLEFQDINVESDKNLKKSRIMEDNSDVHSTESDDHKTKKKNYNRRKKYISSSSESEDTDRNDRREKKKKLSTKSKKIKDSCSNSIESEDNTKSKKRINKRKKDIASATDTENTSRNDSIHRKKKNKTRLSKKRKFTKNESTDESEAENKFKKHKKDAVTCSSQTQKGSGITELKDTGKSGRKFGDKFNDPVTNERMIYIKHDITVKRDDFNNWLEKKKTESTFTKCMLSSFYPGDELSTRCLKEKESVRTPNGVHTRKAISPLKADAIQRALRYYIYKKVSKDENIIKKGLQKMNHYFTEGINKSIQDRRNKNKK